MAITEDELSKSMIVQTAMSGWEAAVESAVAIIDGRIKTYTNKLNDENPPEDTAFALRFAIEALDIVRHEIL